MFWRVRADQPGDHVLEVKVGAETFTKGWAVGGDLRKVPVKRVRNWESLLYPSEDRLPADGPVELLELVMITRPLPYFPDGEGGIVLWFIGISMVAGFALKDLFGVTF